MNARNERIARGWDEAAAGYDAYFVPRFAPWVAAALDAFTAPDPALPGGPILVPCCGTFPELDTLLDAFPRREIVGIDLSEGMIRRARERAAGRPNVSAVVGDAATLDPQWTGRCAAVVSVFGLQQLPDPLAALQAWLAALRPGGRLSVVYWPTHTEPDGPFARIADAVRRHIPAADGGWEHELVPALTTGGMTVESDLYRTYQMTHSDAAAFFDAYVHSGPLRALSTGRGEAFTADLRREFLSDAPTGEWHHRPRARHLLATRAAT